LDARAGTFTARDNVSQFIKWSRSIAGVREVLMFESDDLILRKNEKNFILCLLEIARFGAKFGLSVPVIIKFEQEIERELQLEQEIQNNQNTENLIWTTETESIPKQRLNSQGSENSSSSSASVRISSTTIEPIEPIETTTTTTTTTTTVDSIETKEISTIVQMQIEEQKPMVAPPSSSQLHKTVGELIVFKMQVYYSVLFRL